MSLRVSNILAAAARRNTALLTLLTPLLIPNLILPRHPPIHQLPCRHYTQTLRYRQGDWFCPTCSFHNRSSRAICLQCGEPVGRNRIVHPGDWVCRACGEYNFRLKLTCITCGGRGPMLEGWEAVVKENKAKEEDGKEEEKERGKKEGGEEDEKKEAKEGGEVKGERGGREG